MSRTRSIALGALALAALLGVAVAASETGRTLFYAALTEETESAALSAPAAFGAAASGDVVLIDIRRPDEWAATGLPGPAIPLDMRLPDFTDRLTSLVDGDLSRPVALICARGVRSARLANALAAAGFTDIRDVPEGMLGSRAGPGWLARGLPTKQPEPS